MSEVKGLLFDFNGTLFFDSEFHMEAFDRCFAQYGVKRLSREDMLHKIFGRTNMQIFTENFGYAPTAEQLREFEEYKEGLYISICRETPERLKLCDGACELLDYLKASSIPYCIATGAPLMNVQFYFDELDLGRWFTLDNVVYATGEFPGKPAPDMYQIAAARLGLDASQCAVFEDGTSGIMSANAANAARVIALWEEGVPSPLGFGLRVDASYHDLTDWRKILRELGLM